MQASRGPTLVTGADHERLFRDALTLLRSVRTTLADLLEEVSDGHGGGLKDLAPKQAELESALRRAFEAEARWNEWQARKEGASLAGEIDFDALRQDIACRLERLRACCRDEG